MSLPLVVAITGATGVIYGVELLSVLKALGQPTHLILSEAAMRNVGTFGVDANGKATCGLNHEGERTEATPRGVIPRSSDEDR